jgi:hypothetical protein
MPVSGLSRNFPLFSVSQRCHGIRHILNIVIITLHKVWRNFAHE